MTAAPQTGRAPTFRSRRKVRRGGAVGPSVAPTDEPCTVPGCAPDEASTFVLAAIDDDGDAGPIVRYARAQAERLGLPLRVVHVCTGRERMPDADCLLSGALYDCLPPEVATDIERQIVRDRDPAHALIELSHGAALVVVAANSDPAGMPEHLGECASALTGRTACPLAIVPASGPTSVAGRWR
ncbi:universal stress protein [Actinoplanes sp. NPDC049118]|uniref:universal stress protein n=1 Tax=Actinoplanes sp. NPDC049118 TaxID=3155769 RepID=UPI003403C33D